jgi:hypothetical protein
MKKAFVSKAKKIKVPSIPDSEVIIEGTVVNTEIRGASKDNANEASITKFIYTIYNATGRPEPYTAYNLGKGPKDQALQLGDQVRISVNKDALLKSTDVSNPGNGSYGSGSGPAGFSLQRDISAIERTGSLFHSAPAPSPSTRR